MTNLINFNYIPQNLQIPGFFFEVQAQNNSGLQPFQTLLIGQSLASGSLGAITAVTNAVSATGEVLHFASVNPNLVPGMGVFDLTAEATIPAGTTIVSTTSSTVTLSQAVVSPGPGSGDSIIFSQPNEPILVSSANQAKSLFGVGSMLANMVAAYRLIDTITPLYCLPLADATAGVAATGTITISGAPTANAVVFLYIAGTLVACSVTAAMTATQIATSAAANINFASDLPVTASASAGVITLTARNAGIEGNNIDVRQNYFGTRNSESTPAGLTIAFAPMSGGELNPSLTAPLAGCGNLKFDVIAMPFSDQTSLTSMEEFLSDESGRWNPIGPQLFGHCFVASNMTVGSLTTLAEDQNSQHISILGLYRSPTPPYGLSAALAAQAAVSTQASCGLPFNTLPLAGCLAPAMSDAFLTVDRQTLLTDGISTARTDPAGNLIIERVCTTYTENEFGQADDSFHNAEVMFEIANAAAFMASGLSSQFARRKLAQDGSRIPVGSGIVTPKVVLGSVIALYGSLVDQGIMQGFDQFAANAVAQINALNPNRLDIFAPIQPMSQLDVCAIALQLTL